MHRIDEIYTQYPFYGKRRIAVVLRNEGHEVGIEKVRGLMEKMGLSAIYPKRNLSHRNYQHKIYPYLLQGVVIKHPQHVWSSDITYIRMKRGFLYCVAVIDWYSRYILAWRLSNCLDADFCVEALTEALQSAKPIIFNTDQGVQFTASEFTGTLLAKGIKISMDGRGRALDNIFIERFWRSLKREEVYLHSYDSVKEAQEGIARYFQFYNCKRPHQSLNYKTPVEVYFNDQNEKGK